MKYLLLCALYCISLSALSSPNTTQKSFNKSKRLLEQNVYPDHRKTIYCNADFDATKAIDVPGGFETTKHKARAKRIEWEHVVPAENFGRSFSEWRDGHAKCVSNSGKAFKGRKCAEKMNMEYRYMQSDMYNLFPSIGSVNAMRSNYNFVARVDQPTTTFGSCSMKIGARKAEPPEGSRGRIARAYLYMSDTYPRYKMSRQQAQLMVAWDKQHPVTRWECARYTRIKSLQHNENTVMSSRCNEHK
jgi:deoxyribonuclease-1